MENPFFLKKSCVWKRTALCRLSFSSLYGSFFQVFFELPFDPLQSIVDGLNVAPQRFGDFLIAFSVQIGAQHLLLQSAQHLFDLFVDVGQVLPVDNDFLRV